MTVRSLPRKLRRNHGWTEPVLRIHKYLIKIILVSILVPAGGQAAVLDASPVGFTIEHQVVLPVDRATAWTAVTDEVSAWWSSDHTVSGDAANLYIDAKPLGCFCERLGDDGGLVHLQVTFVNPAVMLKMTGGLGPLGLMGVNGNMTLEFEDAADGAGQSVVKLRYAVGGYLDGGLDVLANAVDTVLGEQLTRLAAHLEAGDAEQ